MCAHEFYPKSRLTKHSSILRIESYFTSAFTYDVMTALFVNIITAIEHNLMRILCCALEKAVILMFYKQFPSFSKDVVVIFFISLINLH